MLSLALTMHSKDTLTHVASCVCMRSHDVRRAVQLGVATKVTTLDKTHFQEVEKMGILLKNRRTSAAASAAASLAGVKGPDDLPIRPEV